MSKRQKNALLDRQEDTENYDIDLAPMLALMVTLIPVMLLALAFVKVTVIETPLPQVVQRAIDLDRKNKNPKLEVTIRMDNSSGLTVNLKKGQRNRVVRLPKVNRQWDLNGLYKSLYTAKKHNPEVFKFNLDPADGVSYKEIVKVIDVARSIKKDDKKVVVKDPKTAQTAETDVMFSEVIFSNVVEDKS